MQVEHEEHLAITECNTSFYFEQNFNIILISVANIFRLKIEEEGSGGITMIIFLLKF